MEGDVPAHLSEENSLTPGTTYNRRIMEEFSFSIHLLWLLVNQYTVERVSPTYYINQNPISVICLMHVIDG